MCDAPVVSAEMQFPRALRLLLMFFASSNTLPCAPVFEIFSLPAKSTKLSREDFVPPSASFCSRRRMNTLKFVSCYWFRMSRVWKGPVAPAAARIHLCCRFGFGLVSQSKQGPDVITAAGILRLKRIKGT